MKRRIVLPMMSILILLQSASCTPGIPITGGESTPAATQEAGGSPTEVQTVAASPTSIGTVSNEKTQVHAGAHDNLKLVEGTAPLGNDDYVSVTDGGKARLEFPGPIRLLLFNDSEVDRVKLEYDRENSYPVIVHKLIRGGYLGYVEPGNKLTVDLEYGVKVNVLGTNFFILYDEENGFITVGKFDGTLTVSIPGQPIVELGDSELVDIRADGSIKHYSPFQFTTAQFEEMADTCSSPIQGVNILRRDHEVPLPGEAAADKSKDLPCGSTLSKAEVTPTASPTLTPITVIDLIYCSQANREICLYTMGLLNENMMITLRVRRENISGLYILLENGNQYPCKEISTSKDKYYCIGKQLPPNINVKVQVFQRVNELLAEGVLFFPALKLTPTPRPRPRVTPVPYPWPCPCGEMTFYEPDSPARFAF
jgi:hypothetical protein